MPAISSTAAVSVMGGDGHIHTVTALSDTHAACSCGHTVDTVSPRVTRLVIWQHLNRA